MAVIQEQEVSVTISGMPVDLLEKIDALAAAEDRSRSAFIRRELEQDVAEKMKKRGKS